MEVFIRLNNVFEMKKVQIKYLAFVSVTMFPATKKTKKPGKYKYN